MEEFTKSIKAILYDRIASPFYGTLIASWLLWNWKIPYVTMFVSSEKVGNKIDYITVNCNNFHHLITFPLISTVLILTVVPIITNGAYWITLIYDKWRNNLKQKIEGQQLLTLKQSIELRNELLEQESKFDKFLTIKENEINTLKLQLSEAIKPLPKNTDKLINDSKLIYNKPESQPLAIADWKDDFNNLTINNNLLFSFEKLLENILIGGNFGNIPDKDFAYFIGIEIISKDDVEGIYKLTDKGKFLMREFFKKYQNTRVIDIVNKDKVK